MRPYTPDDAARAAELDAREARPSAVDWTAAEREAAAEALRKSRLTWGTHSDRWSDTPWQRDFWGEAADTALDALAPFVAAREAQAAAKALREASSWLMDLPSRRGPAVYADERIHADGQDVGIELAADHLRDRADAIEQDVP